MIRVRGQNSQAKVGQNSIAFKLERSPHRFKRNLTVAPDDAGIERDASKRSECRLVSASTGVRPCAEDDCRGDRTDAELFAEDRCNGVDDCSDVFLRATASASRPSTRFARLRIAVSDARISTGLLAWMRNEAHLRTRAFDVSARNISRVSAGAVTTNAWSAFIAWVRACTADSRVTCNTRKASRLSPVLGSPSSGRARTSRAARTASRSSFFEPLRRAGRFGYPPRSQARHNVCVTSEQTRHRSSTSLRSPKHDWAISPPLCGLSSSQRVLRETSTFEAPRQFARQTLQYGCPAALTAKTRHTRTWNWSFTIRPRSARY